MSARLPPDPKCVDNAAILAAVESLHAEVIALSAKFDQRFRSPYLAIDNLANEIFNVLGDAAFSAASLYQISEDRPALRAAIHSVAGRDEAVVVRALGRKLTKNALRGSEHYIVDLEQGSNAGKLYQVCRAVTTVTSESLSSPSI